MNRSDASLDDSVFRARVLELRQSQQASMRRAVKQAGLRLRAKTIRKMPRLKRAKVAYVERGFRVVATAKSMELTNDVPGSVRLAARLLAAASPEAFTEMVKSLTVDQQVAASHFNR